MSRIDDFINNIYEEKIKHKDHRMHLVSQKLIFTIGIFSIGSIVIPEFSLYSLLYLVPFVSLSYDVYIFAEDYKVKRIGIFLKNMNTGVCDEEKDWEKYVNEKREPLAALSSLLLTIISLIAAAIIIYNRTLDHEIFTIWLSLTVIAVVSVCIYGRILKTELKKDS